MTDLPYRDGVCRGYVGPDSTPRCEGPARILNVHAGGGWPPPVQLPARVPPVCAPSEDSPLGPCDDPVSSTYQSRTLLKRFLLNASKLLLLLGCYRRAEQSVVSHSPNV